MEARVTPAKLPPLVRGPITWYGYLTIGLYIYLLNVQGNVIPFLQAEFALSYRVVSLHTSAIAAGIILGGLFGDRVTVAIGRQWALWIGAGSMSAGAFLLCLSTGPAFSIASCFVMGLGGSFIPSVVPAMFSDIHGERRGEVFAEQAILAYSLGVLGPLSSGFFVSWGLGWRYPVILGAVYAAVLILIFRKVRLPDPTVAEARADRAPLPRPFWAYFCLLGFACASEFCILLWAPAFLERVVGYAAGTAALVGTAFFIGVLAGRVALRALLRRIAPRRILFTAFALGFVGFAIYWGIGTPLAAAVGIFCLGLCVAPLYPITMSLGIGAAKGANDAAASRLTLAFGISLLVAPVVLGILADQIGLRLAHLILPVLFAAALASFLTAGFLERRA